MGENPCCRAGYGEVRLTAKLRVPQANELRVVIAGHGRVRPQQLNVDSGFFDRLAEVVERLLHRASGLRHKIERTPAFGERDLLALVNDRLREFLRPNMLRTGRRLCDRDIVAVQPGSGGLVIRHQKLQIVPLRDPIARTAAVEQVVVPVGRVHRDAVDRLDDVVNLLLIRLEHELVVGGLVRRMDGNLPCVDQCAVHLVQCCFSSLHERDTHFRVVDRLLQACRLCPQTLGNLQVRRSVSSAIDLESRTEALKRLLLSPMVVHHLTMHPIARGVRFDS